MKLAQWFLAFALCFFSFLSKNASAQEYLPIVEQQHCVYKKPIDKPQEIHHVKQEKQTTILKVNKIDLVITSLDSALNARSDQPSLILLQSPLSTSLLKLEILAGKHHPPTA